VEKKRLLNLHRKELLHSENAIAAHLLAGNDAYELHRYIKSKSSLAPPAYNILPVQDTEGNLLTEPEQIRRRTKSFFKEQSREGNGAYLERDHWENIPVTRHSRIQGCDEPFTANELLLAIRYSKNRTAPGSNGTPIGLYQELLRQECNLSCAADRAGHAVSEDTWSTEDTYRTVSDEDLGRWGLMTALARHLLSIFNAFLSGDELVPSVWLEGTIITLPKKGDPTDLANRRGITLSQIEYCLLSQLVALAKSVKFCTFIDLCCIQSCIYNLTKC
jgi:hypothetical protein